MTEHSWKAITLSIWRAVATSHIRPFVNSSGLHPYSSLQIRSPRSKNSSTNTGALQNLAPAQPTTSPLRSSWFMLHARQFLRRREVNSHARPRRPNTPPTPGLGAAGRKVQLTWIVPKWTQSRQRPKRLSDVPHGTETKVVDAVALVVPHAGRCPEEPTYVAPGAAAIHPVAPRALP